MSYHQRMLKLLNIQRGEWPLVQRLFLLQFFQGAGIALFFTSALSQFLDRYPISELAYVFMISAGLLWITGYVCNKLEHRLSVHKLSLVMTFIMATSMFLFWVFEFSFASGWFYYIMLAWFNVLYLINNLEFWGLAAQLYDVRQSKRLFGVISSGDIPAKFLGYTLALLLVPYIGTQNLLLAGFVGMLLSLLFIQGIFKTGELENIARPVHKVKQHHTAGLSALIRNFSGNKLIMTTAVLSMLAFTGFVLIEYAFYAEIKESDSYKSDLSFAAFTAAFMGASRLVAWILKLGFTSRIVAGIGNRNALLITPIALLMFNVIVLLIVNFNPGSKLILYVFGSAAILVDALRASINSPVLLTILQPLAAPERLRAHNIIKGIMDPFAYLAIGIFLFILYKLDLYKLEILCYVLIGVSVVWAFYVFLIQKHYLKVLIQTISSRYFTKEEFNLYEKGTLEKIAEKINNGTELEVLYLLRMLEDRKDAINEQLIASALSHPSTNVCLAALDCIQRKHMKATVPEVEALISNNTNSIIRAKAIRVHSSLAFNHGLVSGFLSSDDSLLQQAAIISIINHSVNEDEKKPAIELLQQLSHSTDANKRLIATALIGETTDPVFEKYLLPLLDDMEPGVQKAAIYVIGKKAYPDALTHLPNRYHLYEKDVTEAFVNAGYKSMESMRQLLLNQSINTKQRQHLILACGRIGGHQIQQFLLGLLAQLPAENSSIIKALNRSNFHTDEKNTPVIDTITHNFLIRAVEVLFMLNRLHASHETKGVLFNSLHYELLELRESLLNLFSFFSEKEQVDKIRKALQLNKKEAAANALELIEVTIKKEYASTFNTIFEESDISFRCSLLKKIMPESFFKDIENVVTRVLEEEKCLFNHWTKACSLHTCKQESIHIKKDIIQKYLLSENILLRETAAYAVR